MIDSSNNEQLAIIVLKTDDESYIINRGKNSVGRSSKSIIHLDSKHKSVSHTSRKHCTIYYDGNSLSITSNSIRGVTKIFRDDGYKIYLNHNQVSPLYIGDTIQMGLVKGKLISINNTDGHFFNNSSTRSSFITSTTSTTTTTTPKIPPATPTSSPQALLNNFGIDNSSSASTAIVINSSPPSPLGIGCSHSRRFQKKSEASKKISSTLKKKKVKKQLSKRKQISSLSSLFDKINIGSSISNNFSDVGDENEINISLEQDYFEDIGNYVENDNDCDDEKSCSSVFL